MGGAIVCKLDLHKKVTRRGYIAMLAVDQSFRKRKIGSTLVQKAIEAMVEEEAEEVVLETEITNKPALRLYEALGFVRDKRLFRYYLNGVGGGVGAGVACDVCCVCCCCCWWW